MDFRIKESIFRHKEEIKLVSDSIYSNPETAFNENMACQKQISILRKNGFDVECPAGGLNTAYKASDGNGEPVFCFMSEYDALEEKGHACGHNLIAAAALAAGCAAADIIRENKIQGRIVVTGTPAEEGKGGKIIMIGNGAFNGIDAALISHPFHKTVTETGWLAASRYVVSFRGKSSHAAVSPEMGKNALDAMILFFNGINAWRQQMHESSRVHGIITDGGKIPNAIPDYTECFFYIRAENELILEEMKERFRKIAEGAALMTGTECGLTEQPNAYSSNVYNQVFDDEYFRLATEAGLNPSHPDKSGRGSSDFANVSRIMPCINLMYGITDREYPLHSDEFKTAAGTLEAFDKAMEIAAIMTAIALRYITEKDFRDSVNRDFLERRNTR